LVIASALDDLLREEAGLQVLVIMDEFYQLGRLKIIQNAMSLARGYGLQMSLILQDLTQLQEWYKDSWETFLGNAGIRQFFAPRENTTAEYVSKLCGETTVTVSSSSSGRSQQDIWLGPAPTINDGTSTSQTQRRLLLPQEVCQLPDDQFLMFADKGSKAVIRGYRLPYWEIPEFQGKYSPDPYHLKSKPKLSP
jgi:type IV secretion system protein VirD4